MLRAIFLAASLLVSCSSLQPAPPAPYEVVFSVTSDPNTPLPGAQVLFNGGVVATTSTDGSTTLKLRGEEGESLMFSVRCPERFQSPSRPIAVTLRRLASPGARPEYEVSCPPTSRTVVVAVRADNGTDLPVMYLGREVARTDESGAAHVLLALKPDEAFQLLLSTEAQEGLRPQNPVATFVVKNQDAVFTFDQAFSVVRKRWVGPAKPKGPTRL